MKSKKRSNLAKPVSGQKAVNKAGKDLPVNNSNFKKHTKDKSPKNTSNLPPHEKHGFLSSRIESFLFNKNAILIVLLMGFLLRATSCSIFTKGRPLGFLMFRKNMTGGHMHGGIRKLISSDIG